MRGVIVIAFLLAFVGTVRADNCVINGSTIYGSVEQHCVILGPVPPGLRVVETKPIKDLGNGTFLQQVIVELSGGYAAPRVAFAMKGNNILNMQAHARFSGGVMATSGHKDDLFVDILQNPVPGQYEVDATTRTVDPVTFLSEIQQQ